MIACRRYSNSDSGILHTTYNFIIIHTHTQQGKIKAANHKHIISKLLVYSY